MYLKITSIITRASVDLPWPTAADPKVNMAHASLGQVPSILKVQEISEDQLTLTRSGFYDPSFDYTAFKQQPEVQLLWQKSKEAWPLGLYTTQEIVEYVDTLPE